MIECNFCKSYNHNAVHTAMDGRSRFGASHSSKLGNLQISLFTFKIVCSIALRHQISSEGLQVFAWSSEFFICSKVENYPILLCFQRQCLFSSYALQPFSTILI